MCLNPESLRWLTELGGGEKQLPGGQCGAGTLCAQTLYIVCYPSQHLDAGVQVQGEREKTKPSTVVCLFPAYLIAS